MSDIENMVSQLVSGDKDSATESLNRIFSQKVAERLDSFKQDVGHTMFNQQESKDLA
jgi:hypothetical protein